MHLKEEWGSKIDATRSSTKRYNTFLLAMLRRVPLSLSATCIAGNRLYWRAIMLLTSRIIPRGECIRYNMLLAAASYDLGKNDLTDLPIVQLSSDLTCACGALSVSKGLGKSSHVG